MSRLHTFFSVLPEPDPVGPAVGAVPAGGEGLFLLLAAPAHQVSPELAAAPAAGVKEVQPGRIDYSVPYTESCKKLFD